MKGKRICVTCGEVIFNRAKHAKYCADCAEKHRLETQNTFYLRRKVKGFAAVMAIAQSVNRENEISNN